jgi:hypothetical protein
MNFTENLKAIVTSNSINQTKTIISKLDKNGRQSRVLKILLGKLWAKPLEKLAKDKELCNHLKQLNGNCIKKARFDFIKNHLGLGEHDHINSYSIVNDCIQMFKGVESFRANGLNEWLDVEKFTYTEKNLTTLVEKLETEYNNWRESVATSRQKYPKTFFTNQFGRNDLRILKAFGSVSNAFQENENPKPSTSKKPSTKKSPKANVSHEQHIETVIENNGSIAKEGAKKVAIDLKVYADRLQGDDLKEFLDEVKRQIRDIETANGIK